MAYFSKEIYDRKRDYAYRISNEGLEKIALYLVAENPKYKNVNFESDDELLDEMDSEIEGLIYELEPIAELSHKRHEIHSDGDDSHMDWWDNEIIDIITKVTELNDTYNLINIDVPSIDYEDEGVDLDWDNWLICDVLDLDEDEYLEDGQWIDGKYDEVYEKACEYNRELKDEWSDSVRKWFKEINKKFDTDFPD